MICVDASVAVKWLLDEEYKSEADALLDAAIEHRESLIGPNVLADEVTNTLRQRQRRGLLTLAEGRSLLADFLALPIALHTSATMHDDALVLAERYRLSTTYDASYVALAESFGAAFWTADERLLRALGGQLAFVHWVGDYPG